MNEDWRKLADNYDDRDWNFSSASSWEKIVQDNPSPINKILFVNQLRLSGNYSRAKEVLQSVELNEIPENHKFVYFIHKGMLYKDQEETSKAIKCFRKSIEYENDETYPFIFLAGALSKKSKLDEVEIVLNSALGKKGDIDEVNYNLSLNYARKGNFDEAIRCMINCIELNSDFPGAKIWLEDFNNMKNK